MEIDERTAEVYDAIVAHVKELGYTPSLREIGRRVGMTSASSVYAHVNKLEAAGWIERCGPQNRIRVPR
jgi:repressor LexA